MAHASDPATDFTVPVDGIGTFTFAKKTMADMFAIEASYSRLTEGVSTVTNFLGNMSSAVSELTVLTVSAPAGWDIAKMDPEDSDSYRKIMKVWGALCDKREAFRKAASLKLQEGGAGASTEPGVLVPPQIQPGAD